MNGVCTSKKDGTACKASYDCESRKCENGACVGKNGPVAKKAIPVPIICKGHTFIFTNKKPGSCTAPASQADATIARLEGEIKKFQTGLTAAKEVERKKRNTAGSGAMAKTYPSACNSVDPSIHVEVKDLAGQCVPARPGWWWKGNKEGLKELTAPGSYSDSNDFSLLGSPSKAMEESSKLSRGDRNKARRAIRARTYTTKAVSCDYTFVEATQRLSAECEFDRGSLFVNGNVSYRKKQSCKNECDRPPRCDDTCGSHSDCNGWLCGCSRSRCVWGRCTACPAECTRECEEPDFVKSGGKALKVSTKVSKDRIAEAKALSSGFERITFKPSSVYRKVFTKRSDGETEIEHDTGFYVKIILSRLAVVGKDDKLFTLKGRGNWKFTAELDGKKISMNCSDTSCTASLKR